MSILQKLLAQFLGNTEARLAMSTTPRLPNRGHAFTAVFITAAFLWAMVLSVSPQLHQRIHRDANRIDHTCAVTFVASGSYEHVAATPLVSAPASAAAFGKIPGLTPHWVESPFLSASIFEHAPPAHA
jgi:hypothetical protein